MSGLVIFAVVALVVTLASVAVLVTGTKKTQPDNPGTGAFLRNLFS